MINRQVNYFASVKLLALLLCTLTFLHSAIAQEGSRKRELPESAYHRGDKWWVPPVNLSVPNATYQIFKSKEVGQEVGYVEYLPPNYHEDDEAQFSCDVLAAQLAIGASTMPVGDRYLFHCDRVRRYSSVYHHRL